MSEWAVLGSFWPLQPCVRGHGGTAVVNRTVASERPVEAVRLAVLLEKG